MPQNYFQFFVICINNEFSLLLFRAHDFSVGNFDERTVMICDQVSLSVILSFYAPPGFR